MLTVVEEGTVEIALCPTDQIELLREWCTGKGIEPGGFQGPKFDDNCVERLKRKIEKEQQQLPPDSANAILIDDTDIFFRSRSIREVINQIEEEVYKYAHVPLVIVHGSHLTGAPPEVLQKGQHRYTRKSIDRMYTEDEILFVNRYSPTKLSANLLSKFLRAF